MPSSSSLALLAAKLSRVTRPQPILPVETCRSFSSKAKAKGGKEKESKNSEDKEKEDASAKKSNKKPHWSQQVFYKVSPRLSDVLQPPDQGLTRPEAVERLWDYIKTNNLQTNDEIVCDEVLKKAFGQARVSRGEVLKLLDVNLTRLKPGQLIR